MITTRQALARPRRRWAGQVVNPEIREPTSPGPWVDETRCQVCGATYEDHRAGADWTDAVARLRGAARSEGDDGGGYRTRRPVLWVLRTLKLEDWYQTHHPCGYGWDPDRHRPYPLEDRAMERERLPPVIELETEDFPDEVWVRGHFDPDHPDADRALEAARLWLEDLAERDGLEDWTPPRLGIKACTYARWSWGRDLSGELVPNTWRPHVERGRGAIPVTQILDLDAYERRQAARQAEGVRSAVLQAMIRRWLPEATSIRVHAWPAGSAAVRIELPGLQGSVDWREDHPGHVYVQHRDLDAWDRLYARRDTAPKAHPVSGLAVWPVLVAEASDGQGEGPAWLVWETDGADSFPAPVVLE